MGYILNRKLFWREVLEDELATLALQDASTYLSCRTHQAIYSLFYDRYKALRVASYIVVTIPILVNDSWACLHCQYRGSKRQSCA